MSEGGVIRMIGDILCENVSKICYMKSHKCVNSESVCPKISIQIKSTWKIDHKF